LLIGIMLIATAVTLLSQLVLTVGVTGTKVIDRREVLARAAALGLKPGVWQRRLDLTATAERLKDAMPDAAWVGITRQGTHLEITVVEKVRPNIPKEAGNLVAAKTGLVKEIIVIQGVPQVHEGEMVRAGQVLIAQAPNPEPLPQSPAGKTAGAGIQAGSKAAGQANQGSALPPQPAQAAKGFVRGRVWYSAEAAIPLIEDKVVETGRYASGWGIKFNSSAIMVTASESPFVQAAKEVQVHPLLVWRNWRFPVELINVTYKELASAHIERSVAEARQAAEAAARAAVQDKIPRGAAVTQEMVRVLPAPAGAERVRVEVETYEDLAVYANP